MVIPVTNLVTNSFISDTDFDFGGRLLVTKVFLVTKKQKRNMATKLFPVTNFLLFSDDF